MKVYLHSENERPRVSFRAEDLEHAQGEHVHHEGLRGWFERKAAHYKTAWRTSESAVVQRLRVAWDWLHRRTYPDEPLLAHLRSVPSVEVAHAPALERDDAVKLWETYLASRQRRHGAWFAVNLLISPLTVLLAPLPGPNLIGYWFAYRAFHHGLILAGLRKAKTGRVPATFHEADQSAFHGPEGEPDAPYGSAVSGSSS